MEVADLLEAADDALGFHSIHGGLDGGVGAVDLPHREGDADIHLADRLGVPAGREELINTIFDREQPLVLEMGQDPGAVAEEPYIRRMPSCTMWAIS